MVVFYLGQPLEQHVDLEPGDDALRQARERLHLEHGLVLLLFGLQAAVSDSLQIDGISLKRKKIFVKQISKTIANFLNKLPDRNAAETCRWVIQTGTRSR